MVEGCSSDLCTYCPYVITTGNTLQNDRQKAINPGSFTPQSICDTFHPLAFISMAINSNLTLQNVTFVNLKEEFGSLISISTGSLTLTNVICQNITVNQAVILQTGANLSAELTIVGGVVEQLNNGFEYQPGITYGGFLISTSVRDIKVNSMIFQYNFLGLAGTLMSLSNFLTLQVTNCQFYYNFGSLLSVASTLILPEDVDANNTLIYFSLTHLSLTNSTFTGNSGNSLISVSFSGNIQNIEMSNCSFTSCLSTTSGLVSFLCTRTPVQHEISGESLAVINSGTRVRVMFPKMWVQITAMTFQNCSVYGNALMSVQSLANVLVQSMSMSGNGDIGPGQQVSAITLQAMINYPGMYISRPVTTSIQNCTSLVYFQSIYNLNFLESTLSGNTCKAGSAGVVAVNLYQNSVISAVKLISNSAFSSSLGAVFDFTISGIATFQELTVSGNNAYQSASIMKVTSSITPVICADSYFSSNSSPSGSALFCLGSIQIINTQFISNLSSSSSAAVLYSPIPSATQLSITSVSFINNISSLSGALTLTNISVNQVVIQLTITLSVFKSNISKTAGIVTISSVVSLTSSSLISQSLFVNNTSVYGCIVNSFKSGVLVIDDSVFRNNTGQQVAVLYATQPASTALVASRVVLQNLLIEWNSGMNIIQYKNIKSCEGKSHNLTFQFNNGTGIYILFTSWEDSGSVYRNNTSVYYSPTITAQPSTTARFFNSTFIGNAALNNPGSFCISASSVVTITQCAFIENYSATQGGAISTTQASIVYVQSTSFIRNTAQFEGGAMYFFSAVLPILSKITNSTFIDNESASGVVSILITSVAFIGCSFSGNRANDTPGLFIYLAVVNVSDSQFSNQTAIRGAFISAPASSTVSVLRTSFQYGVASITGAAIYVMSSNLTVLESDFSHLTAPSGTALAIIADSLFTISGCDFRKSNATKVTGGILYVSESIGSISGSNFHSFLNGAIVGVGASIAIADSLFYGKSQIDGKNTQGAGFICTECPTVIIQDTVCTGLQATFAPCFFFQVTRYQVFYSLTNCSFENNTAQTMGSVVLSNINAQMTNMRFLNNSVEFTTKVGDGGGLYLTCPQTSGCQVNISDSQFINNTASHNGGGVAWTDYKPVLTNVSFSGNKAMYGSDIASYAIKLGPLTSRRLYQLSEVPSGQLAPENVSVGLLDHYNHIVTTDSSSLAVISPVSANTSVTGSTQVIANKGLFVFSEYQITYPPGNSTAIQVYTSGITITKPLNGGFITPVLTIPVNMRNCVLGESLIADMCYVCPDGKYSLDASKACQDCPSGATCLGNFTMFPNPGYWRSSATSPIFWKCPNANACLGSPDSNNVSFTGVCATGYFGNMCNGCITGYSLTATNNCSQCPSEIINVIKVVGVSILVILVLSGVIKLSLISANKIGVQASIYLKIFVNYLHLVAVAATFNLTWPSNVSYLLQGQENIGSVSEQAFSYDCLIDNGTLENQQHIVFQKTIFIACVPLMILVVSFCFWLLMALFSHKWSYLRYQFVNSLAFMFFLVHPSIVKFMFNVFNCTQIDPGQYWMTSYLNIRCWESEHMKYAMIVALPSIILWGLLTPAITLLVLILNRNRLIDLTLRIQLGFLFTGYQSHMCFWEFVILYRKVAFITLAVFLTNVSIPVQALCAMLVLMAAFYLQLRYKPYYTPVLNDLEMRGILAAGVTIYCGLFYLTDDLNYGAKNALFAIMVSANAYFILYLLLHQCKAVWKRVANRLRRRKIIGTDRSHRETQHISNMSGSVPLNRSMMLNESEGQSNAINMQYSDSSIEIHQDMQRRRVPLNTPEDSLEVPQCD